MANGKSNTGVILVIVALVVVGLSWGKGGMLDASGLFAAKTPSGTPATPAATPSVPGAAIPCIYDGATMTIGPMKEKWNPGTAIPASSRAKTFVNGVDKGWLADSSTQTVTFGDNVVVVYGGAYGNTTAHAVGYYSAKQTFNVPCASTFATADKEAGISKTPIDPTGLHQIYAMESVANNLTIRIYNDDNGNLNGVADNETMGVGDSASMDIEFKPTFEDSFSPYGNILIVADYNDTIYKDVTIGGTTACTTPDHIKTRNTANVLKCYKTKAPAQTDGSYVKWSSAVEINTESAAQPTGATTNDFVQLTFVDEDYFLNTDTNEIEFGAETDQDVDVGRQDITQLIYLI